VNERGSSWAPVFVATVVLPVAAAARLWALTFGLPHPHCRPDEDAISAIAGAFRAGHFEPEAFNYPALFMLVVAGLLRLAPHIEWLLHKLMPFHFDASLDGLTWTIKNYMAARILSAAAGTASVWVVFRIAVRLFDRATAVAAASLLALAFLHVRDSHYGVTDVPMTFMMLIAFLCAVRVSESGTRKDVVIAGIAVGLAAATKYNGALVGVPVAFAVFISPSKKAFSGRLVDVAIAGALAAATFLVTSPYTLIDFDRFWADFRSDAAHLAGGHGVMLGRGWAYHATTTLRYGVGMPILVAGVAGLLLLLYRDVRRGVLVALFPVTYYALLGSGYTVFTRHMIPVVPFLCLTSGYFVAECAAWIAACARRPECRTALAAAVVILLLWPSARSVVTFDTLLARDDSRLLVRRWIELRFPRSATIAEISPDGGLVFLPYEGGSLPYTLSRELSRTGPRPDIVIVQSSPLRPPPDNIGELQGVLDADYTLAFAAHVVTPDPANVYDFQDEFFLPLTGFKNIERPGPNLDVYLRKRTGER
jgi:hypothetical protein